MERTVKPQVIQTLNEMLEEERAAVEAVIGLTSMATDPTERENLMRIGGDEVWACSGLRDRIEALGGSASRHVSDFASFVLSLEYFPERLRYYGRHQRLIMERITTLLTRKLDDETKVFLEEMYAIHEKDVNWCDQRAAVFEASRDLARHAGESTRFITDRVQHGTDTGRNDSRYGGENSRYGAEPQRNVNEPQRNVNEPYRYNGDGARYSETRYTNNNNNNNDGARYPADSTRESSRPVDSGRYGAETPRGLPSSSQQPLTTPPTQSQPRPRLPRVPSAQPPATTPVQMPIALPSSASPAGQTKTPALPPQARPQPPAAVPPPATPPAATAQPTNQPAPAVKPAPAATARVAPVKSEPPPPTDATPPPVKTQAPTPTEPATETVTPPKVRRTRRKVATDENETKTQSE